ncbi:hypothetical protein L207DRAFT_590601 [Hyaloscypha variabilis F]|uniref:Uncharacterized protein n=1 Tax=Hyaloscypha variabilis (strain UAMH 11265 / GT02V1 / F) TaxID=1149755 RepID=A0A2J6R1B2_HYAVF|nr:hypothetical protein L207DRAFT_590601 [Hyaloscypha variabilis F]
MTKAFRCRNYAKFRELDTSKTLNSSKSVPGAANRSRIKMRKTISFVILLVTPFLVASALTRTIFVTPTTTTTITRPPSTASPSIFATPSLLIFTKTTILHLSSTTTITRLPPPPSSSPSTTTITTHIQTTTTTTVTMSILPSVVPSSQPSLAPNQGNTNATVAFQTSSCTCLTSGAWCGTRSASQVGLNGTCTVTSLYMCNSDADQNPQQFDCPMFLELIFGTQPGASCMEGDVGLNDVCIMPKNGTS